MYSEIIGSDRKSDEEKFSGDVRTESPKENKYRFTDKCKRVLEERNRARLMLLNRQEKQKRYQIIKKRAKQAC
jgi:hypothetical protein